MALPLEGVRIIAVEQFGAGPFGTLHLADLGAEVVKIEDPSQGGDVARTVPPYLGEHDSLYFQSLNRNKLGITLNLRAPGGRQVFEDLVRVSDAVYNNLRGDVPARLGLDYAALGPINPRIVYCGAYGFGQNGPYADRPAYDDLIQAAVGMPVLQARKVGRPEYIATPIADRVVGVAAGMAVATALYRRSLTGVGQ